MKKMLTFAIVIIHFAAHAQFGYDYLKAADRYYKSADYASAAQYYEKYLHPGGKTKGSEYDPYEIAREKKTTAVTGTDQALYHLAESYRQLTNYEKAEPVYKQLLTGPRDITPLAYYHYATVLRAQAKYAEAEQALNTFLDKNKTTDEYTITAQRELQNLRFIQQQLQRKDLQQFKVDKITPAVQGASFAPVWTANDKLLFTATWPDSARNKKQGYTNHVYNATYTGATIQEITPALLPASDMHEGTPAVSADGNTLYLTRWVVKEGKKSAAIFKSTKSGESWSNPEPLNTMVNEIGANAQQPMLMENGKYLVYASDKKGGQGGYDLWIAELNSEGQAVSANNLGNGINTPFNEEAPYYHAASQTLVFASNGRVGMGGYDLFFSKGTPDSWAAPQNLGYPVNSIKDDIYFAAHSGSKQLLENALISSDRTAVCCLELFHVSKTYKQFYSGVVVDCATQSPLADAVVAVTDASGRKIADMVTNSQGQYLIEAGESGLLTIKGSKEKYDPATINTDTNALADTVTNAPICLRATPTPPKELFAESKLEIRNILFAFNDAVIPVADFEFLDQVVDYMKKHPKARIEIGAHTDGKGTVAYNTKLSARRAQSCYNYLVKAGISSARLKAKGYGECCPIETERTASGKDDPAAREKNRRIEIKLL